MAWFSSFSKTNVATNTLLWNTDTLTTPLAALVILRERPTSGALTGGIVGLLGAGLAVGASAAGDTLLGCGLCFSASFGYAVNTVLVEKVRDPREVSVLRLLGLEGLMAVVAICFTGLWVAVLRPEAATEWISSLPPASWLVFLGSTSVLLNTGWLWCAELAGSFWTAMVACSTIPITVLLDLMLVGMRPSPATLVGSLLVIVGFTIASWPQPAAATDAQSEAAPAGSSSGLCCSRWQGWSQAALAGSSDDLCCSRWQGWSQARAAPLLPPSSPASESTATTGTGSGDGTGTSDDGQSCSVEVETTEEASDAVEAEAEPLPAGAEAV